MSRLFCRGCGRSLAAVGAGPVVCPAAGDGGDHVVGRSLDEGVTFPGSNDADDNPFVRFRTLTHAHSLALAHGLSDATFTSLVRTLDDAVKRVAGTGFVVTPLRECVALRDALGLGGGIRLWVKDETRNVSGSHKARHLMGLAVLGEVASRLDPASGAATARLAIASCGNAALAAAVVARAWDKPLDVYIPEDANANVVRALERLGASVHVCPRVAGAVGDPCYLAFKEAVGAGAQPFCCQGSDNGLTIEGGETLGWEMIAQLGAQDVGARRFDRLFVQVGGGALASACVAAFRDAGVPLPRIHAVQTLGAFPLYRAWKRVVARIAPRLGLDGLAPDPTLAEQLRAHAVDTVVAEELDYAAKHRAEFMWPWEGVPTSIAHGILDDETYDWLAIVTAMIESGGFPLVVSEEQLVRANELGRLHTGIDVDETGSSGLAGLLDLQGIGGLGANESVGVIFSGVRR